MSENNQLLSVEGQLIGMPTAGPESFSQAQLDYLKRALGVDETVLYDAGASPSQSGPWQISEARTNFEWIDVVFGNDSTGSMKQVTRFAADSSYMKLHLPRYDEEPSYKWSTMTLSWNNKTASIKTNSVGRFTIASNGSVSVSTAATQAPFLFQIIGIHRIAGGN
jgi:hypothetical protein